MMGFFARISGLNRLARQYPATSQPEGPGHAKQTVQIGPVRFRHCVTVHLSAQGLYLRPRPVLSRYPAILVPWGEVGRVQDARIYWGRAKRLSIGEPEMGTIAVQMDLFRSIKPYLGSGRSERS
jgi:hypothetical protein